LFEIVSQHKDVPRFVWVIAGKLPAFYLVIDRSPNWVCAFSVYHELASEWIAASKDQLEREEVYPFHLTARATSRPKMRVFLDKIQKNILTPNYELLSSLIAKN
jgi:hypothetical protein